MGIPQRKASKGTTGRGNAVQNCSSTVHVKSECKYHKIFSIFVPKYREKKLYGRLRKDIGDMFQELCQYKAVEILERCAVPHHIHICISFPPKWSIAMAGNSAKAKSAIKSAGDHETQKLTPCPFGLQNTV